MRFLANENFPDPGILLLREADHDVKSIRTDVPSIADQQVIATRKRRIAPFLRSTRTTVNSSSKAASTRRRPCSSYAIANATPERPLR